MIATFFACYFCCAQSLYLSYHPSIDDFLYTHEWVVLNILLCYIHNNVRVLYPYIHLLWPLCPSDIYTVTLT